MDFTKFAPSHGRAYRRNYMNHSLMPYWREARKLDLEYERYGRLISLIRGNQEFEMKTN